MGRRSKKAIGFSNPHQDDPLPKGTKEELDEAYGIAMEYQLRILDYSDKDDIPQEVLDEQRRIMHFSIKGPRRGYSVGYGKHKLVQADVLYILTVTTPSRLLAEKFKVAKKTIEEIRRGESVKWLYEYKLIRRLRTALRGNMRQLFKREYNLKVYGIFKREELLHLITSKRKAIILRQDLFGEIENYEDYYDIKELEVLR